MPGPPPGNPRLVKRRNGEVWRELPSSGYAGPIPDLNYTPRASVVFDWWGEVWRTPMAVVWAETLTTSVMDLTLAASLLDEALCGEKRERAAAEYRQIADRYGLNPQARMRNRWLVEDDEQAADASQGTAAAASDTSPPASGASKRPDPRLYAVP